MKKTNYLLGLMLATMMTSPSFAEENYQEIYESDLQSVQFLEDAHLGDFNRRNSESRIQIQSLANSYTTGDRVTKGYVDGRIRSIKRVAEGETLLEILVIEDALNNLKSNRDANYDDIFANIIRNNESGLSETALTVHQPSDVNVLNSALEKDANTSDEVMSILEAGKLSNSDETDVLNHMIQTNPDSIQDVLNSRERLNLSSDQKEIVLNSAINNVDSASPSAVRQIMSEIMDSGASEEEILQKLTDIYNKLPKEGILSGLGIGSTHEDYEGIGQEISSVTEAIQKKMDDIERLLAGLEEAREKYQDKLEERAEVEKMIAELEERLGNINQELPELAEDVRTQENQLAEVNNTDIIKEYNMSNTRVRYQYAGSRSNRQ